MYDKNKVKQRESRSTFKSCDGSKLKSKGEYWLLTVPADKEVTIKTDVVESDIPLSLSKMSMKRARIEIDIQKDTATIFGKELTLNVISSGQNCVPADRSVVISAENVILDCKGRIDKPKHPQEQSYYSRVWAVIIQLISST